MMKLSEAKAECQRWLDYLERQKQDAAEMGLIASERRCGQIDLVEAKRRVGEIDRRKGLTVYDGARLAEAVKVLMKLSDD